MYLISKCYLYVIYMIHEELTLFMQVNIPCDYFTREISLNILTSCDTFQPIKLQFPHPKNNNNECSPLVSNVPLLARDVT